MQIFASKLKGNSEDITFIDRMLKVSENNENFTYDDIKAETMTLLMGVTYI